METEKPRKGRPETELVCDLTDVWGKSLAVLRDSHCLMLAKKSGGDKWRPFAYYAVNSWQGLFNKLAQMLLDRKTKQAASLAELCEQTRLNLITVRKDIEIIAEKVVADVKKKRKTS